MTIWKEPKLLPKEFDMRLRYDIICEMADGHKKCWFSVPDGGYSKDIKRWFKLSDLLASHERQEQALIEAERGLR